MRIRGKVAYPTCAVLAILMSTLCLLGAREGRCHRSGDTKLGGRAIPRPHSVKMKLDVPFDVIGSGVLVVAVPPDVVGGFPTENYERLIVIYSGKPEAVEMVRFSDLRGRVRVSSAGKALAYCRLLTSPVTWHLWGTKVEVVNRDCVDRSFCFGDRNECDLLRRNPSGYLGIVDSKRTLARLGISSAAVCRKNKVYQVRRTLLTGDSDDPDCYQLESVLETVGLDGSYSCKTLLRRKVPEVPGLTLGIPTLM